MKTRYKNYLIVSTIIVVFVLSIFGIHYFNTPSGSEISNKVKREPSNNTNNQDENEDKDEDLYEEKTNFLRFLAKHKICYPYPKLL